MVWFDLANPTEDEEASLEAQLGIDVPTIEEMAEIEEFQPLLPGGRRGLHDRDAARGIRAGQPSLAPVSFILAGPRLITLRYHEPRAFQSFPQRAEKSDLGCADGESVLAALLEAVVARMADILEAASRSIDALSREVFRKGTAAQAPTDRLSRGARARRPPGRRAARACPRAW